MHMRKRCYILGTVLALLLTPDFTQSATKVVVAFSEFPPYKMMFDDRHTGIDVDILQEIGRRLGYTFHFRNCALQECLELMKQGQADLMTSLLRRAEREPYIIYVQPRYRARSNKVFYLFKESPKSIQTFDDLKNLRIGVKGGANYAPAFDNNKDLNKIPAQSIKLNISKLVAGQIDTFITTDLEGDYWIQNLGLQDRISKARFMFQQLDPTYVGVSKNSILAAEVKKIGRILKKLIDRGVVQRIVDMYTK